jgi:hypothetical protein
MAFMEKQVTTKLTWIEIDGSQGITFVDSNDDIALYNLIAKNDPSEDDEATMLQDACMYYEGDVESVGLKVGYGARMSAPGYLDCTEWSVFDTEAEAEAYLTEHYSEDEDEEDDEDETAYCDGCQEPISDYTGLVEHKEGCKHTGEQWSESMQSWVPASEFNHG